MEKNSTILWVFLALLFISSFACAGRYSKRDALAEMKARLNSGSWSINAENNNAYIGTIKDSVGNVRVRLNATHELPNGLQGVLCILGEKESFLYLMPFHGTDAYRSKVENASNADYSVFGIVLGGITVADILSVRNDKTGTDIDIGTAGTDKVGFAVYSSKYCRVRINKSGDILTLTSRPSDKNNDVIYHFVRVPDDLSQFETPKAFLDETEVEELMNQELSPGTYKKILENVKRSNKEEALPRLPLP